MQENMVVTVEPGCYFIDCVIDDALKNPEVAKHIVQNRLDDFRGTGGVRLEDVVALTAEGVDNYTTCPRTVEEVEHVSKVSKRSAERDVLSVVFFTT